MEYFISKYGIKKGPYSISELKEMKLLKNTLAWHEGLEEWKAAEEIVELNEIAYSPPPSILNSKTVSRLMSPNKLFLIFIIFFVYTLWTYVLISSQGSDKDWGLLNVPALFFLLLGIFRFIKIKTTWLFCCIYQIIIFFAALINDIGDLIIMIPYNLGVITLFFVLYLKTQNK